MPLQLAVMQVYWDLLIIGQGFKTVRRGVGEILSSDGQN